MKLEENMYVRTKDGTIERIIELGYQDKEYVSFSKDNEHLTYKNEIKASHNIIDLIEVGDYVNGVMVTEIKDGKPFKEDYNDPYYSYYFDDIYSIVTKEQFEQMQYKVDN